MNLGYQSPIARLVAIWLLALPLAARATPSVVYGVRWVHGVTAHVVTVNLNDPRIVVTVGLAGRGIGHAEPMSTMMRRYQPLAAITGTFFDTGSRLPVGDIVRKGRHVYAGPAGAGFCVSPENTVGVKGRKYGRSVSWTGWDTVLCTGPTLLRNSRNVLAPRAEGYRDPALWALKPRTAVGRTKGNKLLLVCVLKPIHLSTMTAVMRSLGCRDALGLDGGSSCALYAGGAMRVRPGRSLTNVLMVTRAPQPRKMVVARLQREENARLAKLAVHRKRPNPLDALTTSLAVIGK